VFYLSAPSEDQIRHFLDRQRASEFSYPEVGASAGQIPKGYKVDHNRIQLGTGEAAWQRARVAVRRWQMFNMAWLRLCWPSAPIRVGTEVAVLVDHFGFFSLNACRIVYVTNEQAEMKRFGFAYGTLEEHAESGEERFTVEWDNSDNLVWYDLLAFSRPHQKIARLGYPLSRLLQKRFAHDSKRAMRGFVGNLVNTAALAHLDEIS
jgi:uncharacterized protein (UPF0548 family)